jgi:hypothetical protein
MPSVEPGQVWKARWWVLVLAASPSATFDAPVRVRVDAIREPRIPGDPHFAMCVCEGPPHNIGIEMTRRGLFGYKLERAADASAGGGSSSSA